MQLKIRWWIIPNEYEQFVWSRNIRPSIKSERERKRKRVREIESFCSILMNLIWMWNCSLRSENGWHPASVTIIPFSLFISPFVFEAAWFPFQLSCCPISDPIPTFVLFFFLLWNEDRQFWPTMSILLINMMSNANMFPRSRCVAYFLSEISQHLVFGIVIWNALNIIYICSFVPWCLMDVVRVHNRWGDVLSNFSIYCVCLRECECVCACANIFPFINLYTTTRHPFDEQILVSSLDSEQM